MTLEANDLMLFAKVVEEGSFSRAGERLGLPKSTVSRRVAALEAQLGERLLLRTTRKLSLTDFGRGMLQHAQHVADEVAAAQELASHRQAQPSGRLRVSMPADLATLMVSDMLAEFMARYPAIELELDLTPRRVDLVGDGFDVAIRMGDLPDDATLAARRLALFSAGLYASPDYLRSHGTPSTPEGLKDHRALAILTRQGDALPWQLVRDGEAWEGLPPHRARVNSPDLLLRLARAGAGITLAPDHFAAAYVVSGELVPVMPQWQSPPTPAWAVFPGRRLMAARTRVFLDALEAEFNGRCQTASTTRPLARSAPMAPAG